MYRLTVESEFSAAHHLRDYPGKCSQLHGHNYRVEVTVEGEQLDKSGMLADFGALKQACAEVVDRLDHRYLNEVPPFETTNATCENICRHLYDELAARLQLEGVRVAEVRVWESPGSSAAYRP